MLQDNTLELFINNSALSIPPTKEESFGSIDNLCVAEYLEHVIVAYIKKLTRRFNKHRSEAAFQGLENLSSESDSDYDEHLDKAFLAGQNGQQCNSIDAKDATFMITNLRIGDPIDGGAIRSIPVEFTFFIGENAANLTTEYFVLHIMQSYDTEFPKSVAALLEREIDFHIKIVTDIEDWLINEGHFIPKLSGIHECYHGTLHKDSTMDPYLMQKVINQIETTCKLKIPNPEQYFNSIVTRYLYIEQDLNKYEYYKLNDEDGRKLCIGEIKAVLRELAFFQACSWIMEQKTAVDNTERWTFLQNINASIINSIPNIKSGLSVLIETLKKVLPGNHDEVMILGLFKSWIDKIPALFAEHSKKNPCSFPSTLLHMDLHLDNIYFYNDEEDELDEEEKIGNKVLTESSSTSTESLVMAGERGDIESLGEGSALDKKGKNEDCEKKSIEFPQLNNLYFDQAYPSDHIICKISNWKTVSYGNPLLDVANLLYTSVDIGTRQVFKNYLLFYYYNVFKKTVEACNVPINLKFDSILQDFNNQFLLQILLSIGNITPTMNLKIDEIQNCIHAIQEYLDACCNYG